MLGAIAALALGTTAASGSGGARTHAAAGSALQVNLVEYRLMLSEAVVQAGPSTSR